MRRHAPRSDRGSVMALMALAVPVLLLMTAFAVDLGKERSVRRTAQADADVIALDLVRLADGRDTQVLLASADYANVLASSAAANDVDLADIVVEYGSFDDTASPAFTPSTDQCPADPARFCDVPSAVRVTVSDFADYAFAGVIGADGSEVSRTAVAALDAVASLTLGSNTITATNGPLLNFLLSSLIPNFPFDFDTDFAGYQGFASGDVNMDEVTAAAGAASPEELANTDVTAGDVGRIYADALRNDGRTVEADILEILAAEADSQMQANIGPPPLFPFGDVAGADVGGPPAVADADVNALDQFITALQIANGINFANVCSEVPPTSLPIVNTTLEVCTSVIEAGKTGIGRVGGAAVSPPEFRTAQLRVDTTSATTVDTNVSLGPLSVVRVLGDVSLPVTVAGGGAEGRLTEILCDRATGASTTDTLVSPRPISATIAPGASLATLQIRSLGIPIANVTVRVDPVSGVDISPSASSSLVDDQELATTERVPGSGLDFGITLQNDDVVVDVTVLGGVLSPNQLTNIAKAVTVPVVNSLLSGLASQAVTDFLDTLGIGVSESDLRLNDVECGSPLLRG